MQAEKTNHMQAEKANKPDVPRRCNTLTNYSFDKSNPANKPIF